MTATHAAAGRAMPDEATPDRVRRAGANAMLAYKTWCETRARFAIALAAIALAILLAASQGWPAGVTFATNMWRGATNDSARTAFVMLAILLGTGSLRQEQALGSAGFTLALPVSRGRLLAVRAAVAVAEVAALAGLAAILISGVAMAAGDPVELGATLRFAALWSCCGAALAAVALLVSIFIANEYVGWLVTVLALMAQQGVVQVTRLRHEPLCNLFQVMAGDGVTLAAAFAAMTGVAAIVLAAAYLRLRRRDF